jgi:putative addiction module component (TIGR02574 family)
MALHGDSPADDLRPEQVHRMSISFEGILTLSMPKRVQLVEANRDSIAASRESLPITDAQCQELDRRLDAYTRDPSALKSWDEVGARLEHPG